jgi:hypothetical protein
MGVSGGAAHDAEEEEEKEEEEEEEEEQEEGEEEDRALPSQRSANAALPSALFLRSLPLSLSLSL